jgi:hypothetical protein
MIWEILLLVLVSLYVFLRLTDSRYSTLPRFFLITAFSLLAIILPSKEFWGFRWIMAPVYIFILSANVFFAFGPKKKGTDLPTQESAFTKLTQALSVIYISACWVLWAFFPVPDIRPFPGSFDVGYHRVESQAEGQMAYWQIWYPTVEQGWSNSDRYLPRSFGGGNWEQFFRHEARNMGKTTAIRGAVGFESFAGTIPGVFFLPPESSLGEDYTYLLEALASRGFVVVSPLGLSSAYQNEGFFWPDFFADENTSSSPGLRPTPDEVRRVLLLTESFWEGLEGQTWHLVAGRDPSYLQNLPRLRGIHIYLDQETRPSRGNIATLFMRSDQTFPLPPGTGSLFLEGWGIDDFLDENLFSPWQKLQGRVSGFGTGEVMDQVVMTWSHFIGHYLSKEYGTLIFNEGRPFRGAFFTWNP